MSILTLLYDPACGLCRRVQGWLAEQPKLIELRMIPIKTGAAKKRFPELNHELATKVLWALARYREWSYRLASPELLPTTRRVVSLISQHRYQISRAARLSR